MVIKMAEMNLENKNTVEGKPGMEMEYASLRDEILQLQQKRDDYTRFAYTVIAAIWTVAFAIENAYVVLLGMFILMPIAIRVTDVLYSSGNIAAYISVFIESECSAKWETLNYEYRKEYKRQKKAIFRYISARSDFVMLQILNTLIFWAYRKTPPFNNMLLDHMIILIQLLIILFTCYQCHRSAVADVKREENIQKWQNLKSKLDGEEK